MSNRSHRTLFAAAACTAIAGSAFAATSQPYLPAPPLPQAAQAAPPDATPPASVQWIDQQVAQYRRDVEARVARGDMSPDEAERLIGWRQWQLSQQAAGQAPKSAIIARQNDVDRRTVTVAPYPGPYYGAYPAPYYRPYYAPAYAPYYAPGYGPYGPAISVCAGGLGRHYSAAFCF